MPVAIVVTVIYVAITIYLSWLGYRRTRSAADYLLAGRKVHPFLLAMGYGATFISTSAIVGFGGVAGFMGMGLLWLCFLNIFIGIFIAFVFFGKRTRAIGRHLGAHTFPELLGKRFKSKWLQIIAGAIIFITMPLYASAVMIGVVRFIEQTFHINYDIALLGFAFLVMGYVFFGGLKGVMYADGFQGAIMLVGMLFLLIFTYYRLGGVVDAHEGLTQLVSNLPQKFIDMGHAGWTSMPVFGSQLWWVMVSTIFLGVGIGVLAQPQLAVRFMTVNSGKDINRAIGIGSIFILMTVGVTYVTGSLSNLYFFNNFGKIAMQMAVDPATGQANIDTIIPIFMNSAMPKWFTYIFMLILLAAGMSTISSLFHAIGTSFGRDIFQQIFRESTHKKTIVINRIGIFVAFLITIFLAYKLPISIIAIATALFFGLCAACFLSVYCGAIFSRYMTKYVAWVSMSSGFLMWLFWILFIHLKESSALGVCSFIFNKPSLAQGTVLVFVDPIIVSLPVAALVAIVGTIIARKKANTVA
ncbi:MAG: sodium:solute symporter family protein [Candidatus Auribacterota bacterium]|jgi:SSS family solute:Na+ symporter|nr:sodium:solute symporter family protein [Candidatus Auribacterota bacterium]